MSITHIFGRLMAADSNGPIVSSAPPSYTALYIAALLTVCSTGLFFLLQGERERRRNEVKIKEKNDQQMAAVNQSLALLLDKQGDTDRAMTETRNRVDALQTKASSYETSLALLNQAIEAHIHTSELDRASLHRGIEDIKSGVREYLGPLLVPLDRRAPRRDTTPDSKE